MVKSVIGICSAFLFCFVLIASPYAASAAEAKKEKAAATNNSTKSTAKKTTTGTAKAKKEATPQNAPDLDKKAEESFVTFQQEWMKKLQQHGFYGLSNVKVEEDGAQKGVYIAKYVELSEPKESEVRKTANKASPYVGVLKYERWEYVNRGSNPEEARKGPFKPESRELISEVFRYSKDKWVY
jgi:hypothetical protein